MKNFQGHQGDILINGVAELPKTAVPVEVEGPIFLAYGETTGHSHHIVGPKVAMFRDDCHGGAVYLKVEAPAALDHGVVGQPQTADHATALLAPGIHEVVRQTEWSDENEPRVVED